MLSLFFEAVLPRLRPIPRYAPMQKSLMRRNLRSKSSSNSSKNSPGSAKLEATRIEARGNPVVVRAPSNGVQARGQELDYNMKTGVGNLRDGKEVFFLQGRNEIHSRELFFQPSQTSRLGQFKAAGKGWYKGSMPSQAREGEVNPAVQGGPDAEKPIEARWTRHLHFRPHEQNQLLSIEGAAHVQSAATGMIDADQIHLWLLEPVPGSQPESSTKAGGPGGLQPDRLLALGHVRIDSPQLTGRVERMEAWFEQLGPCHVPFGSTTRGRSGARDLPAADRAAAAPFGRSDHVATPRPAVADPQAARPAESGNGTRAGSRRIFPHNRNSRCA